MHYGDEWLHTGLFSWLSAVDGELFSSSAQHFLLFPSCDDICRGQMTLWKLPSLAVSERGLIYVRLIRCIDRSY